ncbi:hypothetical protein GALMADRAFT_280151 [Galerina marginata CBS 339.88]|uniref:SET domain-containing protein n=1 Tax=Galerina marginata (strain CBS 339.88) TaxID=685588 RepID=A0A067SXF9_GALM3|nr:hypothetical protein GALMADRAFT_280151 [Galerina marginata CBS 339.88]
MKRGFLNSSKVKKEPLYPGPSARQSASDEPLADTKSTDGKPELQDVVEPIHKLPYGKVEKTALPESYKPIQYALKETDAGKIDHGKNTIVMTTIPSRTYSGPLDPDGHSEWIVLGPTKAKVLNAPGYPKPLPKPVGPTSYEIQSTPGMGLGVFATRDIKSGDLVFSERPLLVSPRNIGVLGIPYTEGSDMKAYRAKMMFEWEKQLEIAVGRMTPENQVAFKSLINNHTEDGSGPLLGIIRTNGYGADDLFDGEMKLPGNPTAYSCVINIGSRINHSCMPNVTHNFNLASFSFQFVAERDITAGEQLFISYCELDQTAAERKAELAPYEFVCVCPACANATPETDKLRKEYKQRIKDFMPKVPRWAAAPSVADGVIDPVLQLREAMKKEGLHGSTEYRNLTTLILTFYERRGLHEKAKPFKEETSRYGNF